MVRDHKVTKKQAQQVEAMPFSSYVIAPTASTGSTSKPGAAPADPTGQDYFIAAVRQELYDKYGRAVVDGDGLRVTTTLDPTMQQQAYNAIYGQNADALDPAKGEPSGALVSLDGTGAIKALVGGQDFGNSTVDLALGAAGGGSGRQAGSTFKAIMLAEVLQEGYSAASVFPAPPQLVVPHGNADGTPWVVKNFTGETTPPSATLVQATALSINTVYAQVVMKIGADKLDSMAEKLGISAKQMAGAYPSQVLGSADVSPLEMAAAYATFADGGVYHQPLLVTKVTTASGKSLPLPVQPQSRVVLTPPQAAQLDLVLQQVVLHGTGTAAGGLPSAVAGKTGTTDKSTDAWFIGFTPHLTTAVWMGYANTNRPMVGFRGYGGVVGGTIPAKMWHNYMKAVLAALPQYSGTFPPGALTGQLRRCCIRARPFRPRRAVRDRRRPSRCPGAPRPSRAPLEAGGRRRHHRRPRRYRRHRRPRHRRRAVPPPLAGARVRVSQDDRRQPKALDGKGGCDMPANNGSTKQTAPSIRARKGGSDRLVMITAYDAPSARAADAAGVDLILVGDSVAMVVLGYEDTLHVTVADMAHHVAAVSRARPSPMIVADLPWMSYHTDVGSAVENAATLVRAGAQAVKLEGGRKRLPVISAIVDAEIPVMGHLGLTPQSVHTMGGFRVQGKDLDAARVLVEDAVAIESAGCFALVLEGIPDVVAQLITDSVSIPTIGIGAGIHCDGQVLVFHDVLGMDDRRAPKFVRRYASLQADAVGGLRAWADDVRYGRFPSDEETYHLAGGLTGEVAPELAPVIALY
jgi:3-methyl-2-oxobutanoate hydroxymethyltransferase